MAPTSLGYDDLPALIGRLTGDEKHEAASESTLDVLWVLYDQILRVDPDSADDPARDRFLLSKGHGPAAYYSVLAAKGFLDTATLDTWTQFTSPLGHHPDRVLVPGVEIGSGSLGHGLALGVGTALGLRAQAIVRDDGTTPRVYVLTGDGELDEGSNHEAIATAARLGVDNVTAIVIDNDSATHGWPGGIAARFSVEGWHTETVDGRHHDALRSALHVDRPGQPTAVIAHV